MATTTGIIFRELVAVRDQVTITANTTLGNDAGYTDHNIGTDALTVTLPKITADILGIPILFRNIGADGNNIITISPNAVDGVHGTIANATADSTASGTVNKNWVNTKTTANKGDWVELTPIKLLEWYITGGVGIWASES